VPDQVEIARYPPAHDEGFAAERARVRGPITLRKRRLRKERERHVVALRQAPQHGPRVPPDSARVFGDDASINGNPQRRHRADFA
jgi:hypothetical protein